MASLSLIASTSPIASSSAISPSLAPSVSSKHFSSRRILTVRSITADPRSNGDDSISSSSSSSAIYFLTLCHCLKRRGWLNHGIKGAMSIADHMYRFDCQ